MNSSCIQFLAILKESTMSFALRCIVFGLATLLGSKSVLVTSAFIKNSLQEPVQGRRSDYTYTPGIGAHKFQNQWATWNTARRVCSDDGGYLIIINSIAEGQHIAQFLNESHSKCSHVGVHDLYREDDFVTIHGDPLVRTGFIEWRRGEPNNEHGNENCVAIFTDGKLNDVPCLDHCSFVCELPYDEAKLSPDSSYPDAVDMFDVLE